MFLAVQGRFGGPVLLQGIQILQEEKPGSLLGIIELGRTAGFFAEDIVDVSKSLFEHSPLIPVIGVAFPYHALRIICRELTKASLGPRIISERLIRFLRPGLAGAPSEGVLLPGLDAVAVHPRELGVGANHGAAGSLSDDRVAVSAV